jgi:Xaa-Pro aminopeptidase
MEGWSELYGMAHQIYFPFSLTITLQHGTGHGFGSFLNVHEGPHGFSSDVALIPGNVITNEPGFCKSSASYCLTAILKTFARQRGPVGYAY